MALNDNFEVLKYIIVQDERIFIDICERGCGSGCLYCYAPSHNDAQILLDRKQIKMICAYIKDNYNFDKKIISLCPNTEPLKSKESIELVLYIIDFFSNECCYIQISTKERIPEYFLKRINVLSNPKIYINISIPVICNSSVIEPGAASVKERFDNFAMKDIYHNIHFCLYIKPFIMKEQDRNLYLEYINHYQIDTVCIGATFDKDCEVPCISLYNKDKAQKIYDLQVESINEFIELLHNTTKAKVFGSSVCRIYNQYYDICVLELFRYSEQICKDCSLQRSVPL